MLNFSNIMIGTHQPKVLGEFYEKVFDKRPDMHEETWYGWTVGNTFFSLGEHSEVKGKAKEPQRIILNFETKEVQKEFERIQKIAGITIIKEPYEMSGSASGGQGAWIATFADPDGNYFQLMTPWEGDK